MNPNTLLQDYLEHGSEPAFRRIVEAHIDLVYSTALRRVGGDAHLAADVAQTTFTDLARKAATLKANVVLAGWLYRNTCFRAASAVRAEVRRHAREQKAASMNAIELSATETWTRLAPLLDEGLQHLSGHDRDAVVLRYFENKSLAEAAQALGVSEDAAQKRVSRALDKLRQYFVRHGVQVAPATMAAAMTTNTVRPAPASLPARISQAAYAAGTAASSAISFWLAGTLTLASAAAIAWLILLRSAPSNATDEHTSRRPAVIQIGSSTAVTRSAEMAHPNASAPATTASASVPAAPRDAPALLQAMAQTYANCRTYFDRGVVSTLTVEATGRQARRDRPFTTAFVRQDRFRYEFWTEGDQPAQRYIVWSDSATTQIWWTIAKPQIQTKTLSAALAGGTGISGGSAATVPNLLLPDKLSAFKLYAMSSPVRGPDETIDGVMCTRIDGNYGFTSEPTSIWLEKDTGLLRRIYTTHDFGRFRTETTTTYSPVINQPIPDEILQFDPPSQTNAHP